jgi:hypothetical protein
MKKSRNQEPKIAFELHGVTPETVNTIALLRLASSYFEHLRRIGSSKDLELNFEGLTVKNKCVQIAAKASHITAAKKAVEKQARILRLVEPAPPGTEGATESLRDQLRALQPGMHAKVVCGKWSRRLDPKSAEHVPWPRETTALRVVIVRVGGNQPSAAFLSPSERNQFVLPVTQVQARQLGGRLYSEVDIEAEIERDSEGRISGGKLIDFAIIGDGDPAEEWRAWFAAAASGWDNVDDIEAELGRNDD